MTEEESVNDLRKQFKELKALKERRDEVWEKLRTNTNWAWSDVNRFSKVVKYLNKEIKKARSKFNDDRDFYLQRFRDEIIESKFETIKNLEI